MQGNKRANDKDAVVAITRGLHGLRPKALLLFALQELAGIWGIARLRAVSDANHIYRHWQKQRPVAASYDQWWLESGGRLAADGMFDLPVAFLPREIASLKANKRLLYRRRYQQMAEIAAQIQASQIGTIRNLAAHPMDAESSFNRHTAPYGAVSSLGAGLIPITTYGHSPRYHSHLISWNNGQRPGCSGMEREELE